MSPLKRYLWLLVRLSSLLLATTFITFLLVSYSPFDPITAYVGADTLISPEQRAAIASYWGLNDPLLVRYLKWFIHLLQGDLGTSLIYRRLVSTVLYEKASASLILMLFAWLLSGLLGFIFGVIAGVYHRHWQGKFMTFIALLFSSAPLFWLGMLAIALFAVQLQWLPMGMAVPIGKLTQEVTMLERVRHLILPVIVLSITGIAAITLHTKAKMVEVLDSEYLLFARACGESQWLAIYRHGLRNIALPALTLQFASISELFGGSMLAEQVFAYPGLGSAAVQAGLHGDVPLLLGIALFSAGLIFVGNLSANLLYSVIDPRINAQKASR